MDVALTLKDVGLLVIGVGLIVLIVYLICIARHLLETVKRANRILEDAERISGIAASRTEDVDGIIDEASGAVMNVLASAVSRIAARVSKSGEEEGKE